MESLAYDFVVVAVYWEWTWQQVYGTLVDSIDCSLFESKVKEKIRKDFAQRWGQFIEVLETN